MKKLFAVLLLIPQLLILTSCDDGGPYAPHPGNGDGDGTYTHNELAKKFIENLNLSEDFNVTLQKSSTRQENFIVIYDPLTDNYNAINIDNYESTQDAKSYYNSNSSKNHFNLDYIPGYNTIEIRSEYVLGVGWVETPYESWVGTTYRDRGTGLVFEKTIATAKDLAKVSALKEAIVIGRTAEYLSGQFGLSMNRGKEIAKLTSHWKKLSKKGITAAETDKLATELLGFSLSQGITAFKGSLSGNNSEIESLIDEAATLNGITPEHVEQLMLKIFGL